MNGSTLADTGFWLALAARDDKFHATALSRLEALDGYLVTTWPVVTEACHLLGRRLGSAAAVAFTRALPSSCELFDLGVEHLPRVSELMERYADLPMDLADASLVLLAEQLDHGRILTTDRRDFITYRWGGDRPFELLLTG